MAEMVHGWHSQRRCSLYKYLRYFRLDSINNDDGFNDVCNLSPLLTQGFADPLLD
jgi:hypothetical protein